MPLFFVWGIWARRSEFYKTNPILPTKFCEIRIVEGKGHFRRREPARAVQVLEDGNSRPLITATGGELAARPVSNTRADAFVGTNVFIVFDTRTTCIAVSCVPRRCTTLCC